MRCEKVELTPKEFAELNARFPIGKASGRIGRRAEAIVQMYFRRLDKDCQFDLPRNGADLLISFSIDRPDELVEIKGTDDTGVAWNKLKVSSQKSYEMLVEQRITLLRVTKVFDEAPVIYFLKYGEDYDLEPEPRWAIRNLSGGKEQVPAVNVETDPEVSDAAVPTSKYSTLAEFLRNDGRGEVTLKFQESRQLLGFVLPSSAYNYQAFWANQTDTSARPWAKAWQSAGYRVLTFKLGEDGWVTFKRGSNEP